jgi:DNA-binding NarL/FixJ family response regulator
MRIFIADDSALLVRQLIELLCELEGVKIVGQARGTEEALEAIRSLRPDVITLDIQMADGSGIDLLKKVKRENPAPVVIMLTNHASPPYRKKCMQAGADFFFDKAGEINEVKVIIQNLLPRFTRVNG